MSTSVDLTTCSRCGHRNPSWYAACEGCGASLSLATSDFSLKRKAAFNTAPAAKLTQSQGVPVIAHVLSGWPLILVIIGGVIGGALGAGAYGINLAIYKSKMPGVLKVMLNFGVGFTAIAIWLLIAWAIHK